MKRYQLLLIAFLVGLGTSYAQSNHECDEIKNLKLPEAFDEKFLSELDGRITALARCGYDAIEVAMLKSPSFMKMLTTESLMKRSNLGAQQAFNLKSLIDEFDQMRKASDFEEKKTSMLAFYQKRDMDLGAQAGNTLESLYTSYDTILDVGKLNSGLNDKHILVYFTEHNSHNSKNFERLVLTNAPLSKMINEQFNLIILDCNCTEKNRRSSRRINCKKQIELFATNVQPFLGVLNPKGDPLGGIHYTEYADRVMASLEELLKN